MGAIALNEFKSIMLGYKTIIIVLFFVILPVTIRQSSLNLLSQSAFSISAINLVVGLFGAMFVLGLSLNTVCGEFETRTIRLLVTKISRAKIIIGKCIGILAYWILIISFTYLLLSLVEGRLVKSNYLSVVVSLFYYVTLCIFLSSMLSSVSQVFSASLIVGGGLPIISVLAIINSSQDWAVVRFFTPLYYLFEKQSLILVPLVLGLIMLILGIQYFSKRDV